jgi:hypothetical protein
MPVGSCTANQYVASSNTDCLFGCTVAHGSRSRLCIGESSQFGLARTVGRWRAHAEPENRERRVRSNGTCDNCNAFMQDHPRFEVTLDLNDRYLDILGAASISRCVLDVCRTPSWWHGASPQAVVCCAAAPHMRAFTSCRARWKRSPCTTASATATRAWRHIGNSGRSQVQTDHGAYALVDMCRKLNTCALSTDLKFAESAPDGE